MRHFFVIAGGTLSGKKKRQTIAVMIENLYVVVYVVEIYATVFHCTIPKMKNPPEHLIPEGFGGEAGI